MKTFLFTAAAFAAPVVWGAVSPIPQLPTNTTLKTFLPMAKRFSGETDECQKMCEPYRPLNHCVSDGWQNNCYDQCFHSCIVIGGETTSPSESDLIQLMSESSEWTEVDARFKEYSTDERADAPCQGYCRRSLQGAVLADADFNATVDAMLTRVAAYGQVFRHLQRLSPPVSAAQLGFPVGTRLDATLRSWVAGFKERLAAGEDLREWYEGLFKRVELTEGPTGAHWAYRFERVVSRDNEKELGELVQDLSRKKRRAVVKAVRKTWDEQFGDVVGDGQDVARVEEVRWALHAK